MLSGATAPAAQTARHSSTPQLSGNDSSAQRPLEPQVTLVLCTLTCSAALSQPRRHPSNINPDTKPTAKARLVVTQLLTTPFRPRHQTKEHTTPQWMTQPASLCTRPTTCTHAPHPHPFKGCGPHFIKQTLLNPTVAEPFPQYIQLLAMTDNQDFPQALPLTDHGQGLSPTAGRPGFSPWHGRCPRFQ
jgi:hypothetical protein